MKKPKLLIIVLFQNLGDECPYYARNPAPPLPGILLAGMTPPIVEIEVLHEMVRPIDYNTDADFIALSFMDYIAPHACEVARRFRALGKIVVAGGKFASTHPDEVQPHFHSILVGEAQGVWPRMVHDLVNGKLKPRYEAEAAPSLRDIPPPRYDLVESSYATPIVTEASRGCPHPCTYCALNIKRMAYRTRPVEDVIRDLTSTGRLPWYKRKMAMILDNNLGGDLKWAKELLREIAKLRYWGIGVQFSVECLRDDEFVELLARANCRMAFIGMESLNQESLAGVQKRQNKVQEYKEFFAKLNRRGILTFTGFMFALDEDTASYYEDLPHQLDDVGTNVILPSISIPIYGTPLHRQMMEEGRIVDFDLSHYEGDHLLFRHKHLSDKEIYEAYERINTIFFSWKNIIRRWIRFIVRQRKREPFAQFLLKLLVTSFVYYKLSIFQRHHAQIKVLQADRNGAAPKPRRDRRGESSLYPPHPSLPSPGRRVDVERCEAGERASAM
jgi:radical SAM superfamily enzyme YgiQ (UPF0313 family)